MPAAGEMPRTHNEKLAARLLLLTSLLCVLMATFGGIAGLTRHESTYPKQVDATFVIFGLLGCLAFGALAIMVARGKAHAGLATSIVGGLYVASTCGLAVGTLNVPIPIPGPDLFGQDSQITGISAVVYPILATLASLASIVAMILLAWPEAGINPVAWATESARRLGWFQSGWQTKWRRRATRAGLVVTMVLLGAVGANLNGFAGGAIGALVGLLGPLLIAKLDLKRRRARARWRAWESLGPDAESRRWSESEDGYASLLRADRSPIAFVGRDRELEALRRWCENSEAAPALLVTGPGGIGKTRLALKLASVLRPDHWLCKFVEEKSEKRAIAVASAVARGRPVLLIIDYAEVRDDIDSLLKSAVGRKNVRVLLLARSTEDWWGLLLGKLSKIATVTADPIELAPELTPGQDDETEIQAAYVKLSAALEVRQRRVARFGLPAERSSALTLQAAALLAALEARAGAWPDVAVAKALNGLLLHEAGYWRRAAEVTGLPAFDLAPLGRAVAVACLIPVADEDEAAAMLRRVPDLTDVEGSRRAAARWLKRLYPNTPTSWIGPLQPDLLAEHHVCSELLKSREFERACLSNLRGTQVSHALTLLARAARHHPEARNLVARALREKTNSAWQERAVEVAARTNTDLHGLIAMAITINPPALESLRRIATMRFPVDEHNRPADAAAAQLLAIESRKRQRARRRRKGRSH
jgi:hypothetical protein